MGIPRNYDGLTYEMVMQIKHKSYNLIGTAGFTVSDRDDIESELAWHLRERLSKHEPSRAKLPSFVNVVLNNKIANMIEARKSWHYDFRDHQFSLDEQYRDDDGWTYGPGDSIIEDDYLMRIGRQSISALGEIELRAEIESIVSGLPDDLKDLCHDILKFGSIPAVSENTGTPRATLYHRVRKLQRAFRAAGFEK